MADERDRLRARLDLAPLSTASTPAPVVDERTQRQAMTLTPAQLAARQSQAEAAQAQTEAATALTAAKENAAKLAKQLGAKVDPNTGKIDVTTIPRTSSSQNMPTGPNITGGKTVVSTYTNPTTGDVIAVYSDGSTGILSKGSKQADAAASAAATKLKAEQDAAAAAEAKRRAGQSAFDLLKSQFALYGLEGLVADVEKYIKDGLSQAEFTLRLRTESDAYKQRFGANQSRIQKGLRALSEAEYINLEDQYQDVMRRYGLPESYYKRGDLGRQEGFEKFIGGDVSPVELEDRIQTAQRRVMNTAPQIKDALTQYYGDEISNGDILAYVLDPNKAIENIKRKVTAAEIGGAAKLAGLGATRTRAEELGALGVTSQQAREKFQAISEFLPTATKLGDIYAKQGMGPFTQTTAEAEVFGTTGAAEAAQKRKKLTQLETAQFSGQVGAAGGALGRERAGQF
jgi:predicted component of type VI protein secretion system